MALLTTMPAIMITPIKAMALTGTANRASVSTTPTSPNGTAARMMRGCSSDSNWAAITR